MAQQRQLARRWARRWIVIPVLAFGAPAAPQCQPEWSALGDGVDWQVLALKVFAENNGPANLFAGGNFVTFAGRDIPFMARWDGYEASMVGGGITDLNGEGPSAFEVVGPGQGVLAAGLYIVGAMPEADGIPVNGVARWDGKEWHDVGGGFTSGLKRGFSACLFDEDGDGPDGLSLFVGGLFHEAGGVPAEGLARWDGVAWSQVGGGIELEPGDPDAFASVSAMAVFDDGRGPALYAGGSFYYAGGMSVQNIARWDGQNWEALGGPGGGVTADVGTLSVYDEDGDGPMAPSLFVGGSFNYAGGKKIMRIARWDGQDWTDVGGWLSDGSVMAMAVWKGPDDERENLYIGGTFNILPDLTQIKAIARWDGQAWREVDYGVSGAGGGTHVGSLAAFDEDGDGPNPAGLYVGGLFYYVGANGLNARHIARWGCPLGPRCDADLDKSGTLDLFDFLTFFNLFNTADPAADCDASGSLDLFDFLCFVNAFNEGC